jgi:predicted dehydrogenase
MSDPIRFGLVGTGAIAQSYLQAFQKTQLAALVAVADLRADSARATAEGLGCRAFDSHAALLAESGCDAVIVCTPPSTHAEICVDFLGRGIHVLCEKPLSIRSAEARRMVDAARQGGALLTMGSKFRYVDDVVRAKSIVTSGILGEIVLFENAFTSRVDMKNRWNSDPKISGGGVLIDNGTHSVDLVRYFLGPIAEVHAVEGKRVQTTAVEDTARIFVKSTQGVMGSIDLSWTLNKELESFIDVYGSHGTIRVGWKESKYRQSSSPDWVVFGKGYDKVQAFRSQIENFCKAIRKEEPLLITAEDAIASVEVIEAAYASLERNDWVPVSGDGREGPVVRPLRGKSA